MNLTRGPTGGKDRLMVADGREVSGGRLLLAIVPMIARTV